MFRKEFPVFPSHLKRRRSPQERREELQGRATIPRVPQMSQSIPGKPVFPALPRLSSRGSTHTTVARGTALWESLVGKPRGNASRESHRSLDPREGKRDTAATAREEGSFLCVVGKEFPAFPSHVKRRRSPQERREELQGRVTIPRFPQMSQSIPGKTGFAALPRHSRRGSSHTTVARGTALWKSLVGKPPGKASRESHRSLDPREGKRDSSATAQEESERACPHSRRGLTPLGRLQK